MERGIILNRKITEAQVLGTRQCNMRCGYCRLVYDLPFENADELGLENWIFSFKKMERFGIKTVKGLGGEWTVKEYLPELVRFVNEETRISFALLSNSSFDDRLKKDLVDAGLNGYFASVDHIDATDPYGKSGQGLEMLIDMRELGVENVGANTVIMQQNIKEIPSILEFLTENGIVMNICPTHGGDSYPFEYRAQGREGMLTEKDRPILENMVRELKEMKDDGYFLGVSYAYLDEIEKHAIELDWKCQEFSQLRIDANGDIKVCPDGGVLQDAETLQKYNIMSITQEGYDSLCSSWKSNAWRRGCPGCGPWSAQYRAEMNKSYGIGDPTLQGFKDR